MDKPKQKLDMHTFKRTILNFINTMIKLELEEDRVVSRGLWQELDIFYLDYVASYVEKTPDDQI
jgi:hypothetical protein